MLSFQQLFRPYNNLQEKVGVTASELVTKDIYMNKARILVTVQHFPCRSSFFIFLYLYTYFSMLLQSSYSVAKAEEMEEVTTAFLAAAMIFLSSCEHLHTTLSA